MKGGVGTVFDLMNAANRLASDDPESANKYWEGAKKRARDIADENFRKTWADPDIDDFESDDEHHFQENPTAERKRSRGSQRNMTEEQKVERR